MCPLTVALVLQSHLPSAGSINRSNSIIRDNPFVGMIWSPFVFVRFRDVMAGRWMAATDPDIRYGAVRMLAG